MGATIIAFFPTIIVNDIFSQQEVSGRRCRLINKTQEFNIDMLITRLVRGQGLTILMIEANLEANQINQLDDSWRDNLCDMDTFD